MYNLEEMREQYKGGAVAIVGNGPSLVTMPSAQAHFRRYMHIGSKRQSGEQKNINLYEQPRALVKRIDNHHCPLWTINGGWTYHPKSTLGFLMDDHRFHRAETHPQPEWYDNQMKHSKIPIVTSIAYPQYPAMVGFPIKEAIKRFKTTYFGETVDYMICLAIMFDVKRIEFLGCDYQLHDRFPGERSGTEYWIGRAEQLGIDCDYSQCQNLMRQSDWEKQYHPLFYGYGRDNFPISEQEIAEMLKRENG